eukprot:scaffold69585_cov63-Phaeocystis_antarctica.AAC.3
MNYWSARWQQCLTTSGDHGLPTAPRSPVHARSSQRRPLGSDLHTTSAGAATSGGAAVLRVTPVPGSVHESARVSLLRRSMAAGAGTAAPHESVPLWSLLQQEPYQIYQPAPHPEGGRASPPPLGISLSAASSVKDEAR